MTKRRDQSADPIDLLEAQTGQVLDFNIYVDGNPIAQKGATVTPTLIQVLKRVEPRAIRFSREDLSIRLGEEAFQQQLKERIERETPELIQEAGIEEDLRPEARTVATRKIKRIFHACRYLSGFDVTLAAELTTDLISKVQSFESSAFKIQALRAYDEYTYFHSVNVCVLGVTVFRDHVKDDAELHELGIGLLLHDIGKSMVDKSILNKNGQLTADEFLAVTRHVMDGYKLVKNNTDISPMAKSIILNHHERIDGSGYLRGLKQPELSKFDMIASICDVVDALTTEHVYRKKLNVHRALELLIRNAGTQFSPQLINAFLRGIGRFPVGTFVRLNNGEIGVVCRLNPDALARPMIKVLFNNDGDKLTTPRMLDLYADGSEIFVKEPLDLTDHPGLDPTIDVNPRA